MSSSLHVMGAHQIPLPFYIKEDDPDTGNGALEECLLCDEEAADHEARGAHVCTVHPSCEHHQLSCLLPCDHVVLHDPAYRHKQCINVSK